MPKMQFKKVMEIPEWDKTLRAMQIRIHSS
jgi:hypothetical protein